MSRLQYIRRVYGVPAFRGRRIRYTGGAAPVEGEIKAASGARLSVRVDGVKGRVLLHPTWEVEYLNDPGPALNDPAGSVNEQSRRGEVPAPSIINCHQNPVSIGGSVAVRVEGEISLGE